MTFEFGRNLEQLPMTPVYTKEGKKSILEVFVNRVSGTGRRVLLPTSLHYVASALDLRSTFQDIQATVVPL